jgi:3-hydroxymyristoyl/3-hydroxydecanoyl-(acyl carrier protein) dehydratase
MLNNEIEQLIPHRKPFLFIDQIVTRTDSEIVCQKTITNGDLYIQFSNDSEPYISDVVLIECVLQSGGCLLAKSIVKDPSTEKKQKYFAGSPLVTWGALPKVGDTLTIRVENIQKFGANSRLHGTIFVGSEMVLDGIFIVGEK